MPGTVGAVRALALVRVETDAQHLVWNALMAHDILEEQDGPMLVHGLKRLHRHRIHAPRRIEDRPDPNLLEVRYERFRAAEK